MSDRTARLAASLFLTGLLAAGCSSTPVGEVNNAVMARWESMTDPASRRTIADSFEAAPLRQEDYRLGPEDVLAISIFEWELREETRTLEVRVSQQGFIVLPVLGTLPASGRTVAELQAAIEKILVQKEILKNPRVTVEMKAFQSKRVAVVGAVRDPGVYTLHQNATTLLDVLSLAGGPDERAGQAAYVIRAGGRAAAIQVRPGREASASPRSSPGAAASTAVATNLRAGGDAAPQTITVDLYELLELGNLELNMVLLDGDVVHVPEAAKFFVFGYVREPGGFALKRPTTVLDGIALARGLRENEASPEHCILKRRTAEGETVLPINLVEIARGHAANLFLKPGDILEVRQTANKGFWMGLWDGFKSIISFGIGTRPL